MPTIRTSTTFAGAGVARPLQGSQYEFLPFDAQIEAAIRSTVADVASSTFFSGTDVLLEDAPVDVLAAATPIAYPDDYDIQDVAAAGERLNVTLRATAACVVRTVIRITPL